MGRRASLSLGSFCFLLVGSSFFACSSDEESDLFEGEGGRGGTPGANGGASGLPAVGGGLSRAGSANTAGDAGAAGATPEAGSGGTESDAGASPANPTAGATRGGAPSAGSSGGGAMSTAGAGGTGVGGGVVDCDTAACGGDPVGTWKAAAFCTPPPFDLPGSSLLGCNPTLGAITSSASGTLTLRANGTFLSDRVFTYEFDTFYNQACFGPLVTSPSAACAIMTQTVTQRAGTADCSPQLDGCACTITMSQLAAAQGTYDVSGEQLILSDGTRYDFCVAGDGLVLTDRSTSTTTLYSR